MEQVKLDYSKISTFQACPQRYEYKYIENLEKIEEGRAEHDMNFGRAIHAGLAKYYAGSSWAEIEEAFRTEYPENLDPNDKCKTVDNGIACLDLYRGYYRTQDTNWKVLGIEVKDTFEIEDVTFTVQLDLIAENLQGGGIYFWDHKSSASKSSFDFSYWSQFELNMQIDAYTEYVKLKYGNCSGAYINSIKLGYRERAYKKEPPGFHCKFQRQMFNRFPRQLEAFRKNVLIWRDRIKQSEELGLWGLHEGKQCHWCSFKELCMSTNDEQVKEVIYRKRELKPIEEVTNAD